MRTVALVLAAGLCLAGASAASADAKLLVLPAGHYKCALPGSAAGRAWIDQPDQDFTILRASRYRTADGAGTYLMKGKRVTFTRGPLRGTAMMRVSSGMLQVIEADGKLGRLRCQRVGPPEIASSPPAIAPPAAAASSFDAAVSARLSSL